MVFDTKSFKGILVSLCPDLWDTFSVFSNISGFIGAVFGF